MRVQTFRVCVGKDTLNFVETAYTERDDDSLATRIAKRRKEALSKAAQWGQTHFQGEQIRVLDCDAKGNPL